MPSVQCHNMERKLAHIFKYRYPVGKTEGVFYVTIFIFNHTLSAYDVFPLKESQSA